MPNLTNDLKTLKPGMMIKVLHEASPVYGKIASVERVGQYGVWVRLDEKIYYVPHKWKKVEDEENRERTRHL